jgi:ABC-2 type transport system ATP-binding protein
MSAVIECDRLTKRYGSARGIDELTLRIEPGEVFGFLGPNGAGKTTTIRTLLDLQRPTSGEARIFGLDSRRDSVAIRSRIGNLAGDFALEPQLTGRRALALLAEVRGMTDLGRANELAERFEADLSRPLGELSRGNRQKIGLILALFHDPELVILDEPTSGLDPLMQAEFLTVVGEQRERGATVFLSSHELDEVQRICDRVGIIRDGRLIATDGVERMRERAYRNVAVRFAGTPDGQRLGALPGVEGVEVIGDLARFRIRGSVDRLIKTLAGDEVVDLELTRPSLDELFLDYYREGDAR